MTNKELANCIIQVLPCPMISQESEDWVLYFELEIEIGIRFYPEPTWYAESRAVELRSGRLFQVFGTI